VGTKGPTNASQFGGGESAFCISYTSVLLACFCKYILFYKIYRNRFCCCFKNTIPASL